MRIIDAAVPNFNANNRLFFGANACCQPGTLTQLPASQCLAIEGRATDPVTLQWYQPISKILTHRTVIVLPPEPSESAGIIDSTSFRLSACHTRNCPCPYPIVLYSATSSLPSTLVLRALYLHFLSLCCISLSLYYAATNDYIPTCPVVSNWVRKIFLLLTQALAIIRWARKPCYG